MTNQEINEAVARKLGWIKVLAGWMDNSRHSIHPNIPNYCTDIADVWEIVEDLPYFKLSTVGYMSIKDRSAITKWECTTVTGAPTQPIGYLAEADTAPMAICLAFLKLKESEK